ncbi:MAG: fibronectin type III domain-containing protein [Solirubrobacteraceae bacterium]
MARLIVPLCLAWLGCSSVASAATALDAPTGLYQSSQTETSITVSWTPSDSPGVTGYEIWPNGGAKVDIGADATSYTITGLTCGNAAWIEVAAFDAAGDMSPEASTNGFITTSPCNADVELVSNTASVSHARVGQDVIFTIVARNNGPDAVELHVDVGQALNGLDIASPIGCDYGVGADGTWCEYGYFAPGGTVTQTVVGEVQDTTSGYANDVACVGSFETIDDPNLDNDCAIATVAIDHPTVPATPPPAAVSPASPPGVAMPTAPPRGSGPRSCSAYTVVHTVRSGHGTRRRTIRIEQIVPGALSCGATRDLVHRADMAFARSRSGVDVRISPWLCREDWLGSRVVAFDTCKQPQGPRISWTEIPVRQRHGA